LQYVKTSISTCVTDDLKIARAASCGTDRVKCSAFMSMVGTLGSLRKRS
jgi:hypothetical protein